MSLEGPKMGGERYGSSWNGRKIAKSGDPRWLPPPRLPTRSWERPTAVRREISRPKSSSGGAPTWVARASRGWPETSPTAKTRLA